MTDKKQINLRIPCSGSEKYKLKSFYCDVEIADAIYEMAKKENRPVHNYILNRLRKIVKCENGGNLYGMLLENFNRSRHKSWNQYFCDIMNDCIKIKQEGV